MQEFVTLKLWSRYVQWRQKNLCWTVVNCENSNKFKLPIQREGDLCFNMQNKRLWKSTFWPILLYNWERLLESFVSSWKIFITIFFYYCTDCCQVTFLFIRPSQPGVGLSLFLSVVIDSRNATTSPSDQTISTLDVWSSNRSCSWGELLQIEVSIRNSKFCLLNCDWKVSFVWNTRQWPSCTNSWVTD